MPDTTCGDTFKACFQLEKDAAAFFEAKRNQMSAAADAKMAKANEYDAAAVVEAAADKAPEDGEKMDRA